MIATWPSQGGVIWMGGDVRNCKPAAFPVDPDPEWPPSGSGCGKPYPEPIHHFNAKVRACGEVVVDR